MRRNERRRNEKRRNERRNTPKGSAVKEGEEEGKKSSGRRKEEGEELVFWFLFCVDKSTENTTKESQMYFPKMEGGACSLQTLNTVTSQKRRHEDTKTKTKTHKQDLPGDNH